MTDPTRTVSFHTILSVDQFSYELLNRFSPGMFFFPGQVNLCLSVNVFVDVPLFPSCLCGGTWNLGAINGLQLPLSVEVRLSVKRT